MVVYKRQRRLTRDEFEELETMEELMDFLLETQENLLKLYKQQPVDIYQIEYYIKNFEEILKSLKTCIANSNNFILSKLDFIDKKGTYSPGSRFYRMYIEMPTQVREHLEISNIKVFHHLQDT
jgi:hypothetical protein